MRTRTQLSSLAIAAIAILAAATTSFAQTNDRVAEATSFVAVSGTELTAINNAKQPTSIKGIENTLRESFTAKNAIETRTSAKAPAPPTFSPATFSPAAFSAGSRFATVNAERFLSQQQRAETTMTVKAPSAAADEFSETKTRNVEFVPSRIPKFPYREN